jgi:hypothetical protein
MLPLNLADRIIAPVAVDAPFIVAAIFAVRWALPVIADTPLDVALAYNVFLIAPAVDDTPLAVPPMVWVVDKFPHSKSSR